MPKFELQSIFREKHRNIAQGIPFFFFRFLLSYAGYGFSCVAISLRSKLHFSVRFPILFLSYFASGNIYAQLVEAYVKGHTGETNLRCSSSIDITVVNRSSVMPVKYEQQRRAFITLEAKASKLQVPFMENLYTDTNWLKISLKNNQKLFKRSA